MAGKNPIYSKVPADLASYFSGSNKGLGSRHDLWAGEEQELKNSRTSKQMKSK